MTGAGLNAEPGSATAVERVRTFIHLRLELALTPFARWLARFGVLPNQVSIAGLVLNLVAAALIVTDSPVLAGAVYLLAGALDMLDGLVARIADGGTAFGAFLDSTLDRISEGVVFSALAYRFALEGEPVVASLVVLALLGSLLVSYTRARAEGLGAEIKVGVVTRAERVVLLAFGLLFGLVPMVVFMLVLLTALTVSQRIARAFRDLAPKG